MHPFRCAIRGFLLVTLAAVPATVSLAGPLEQIPLVELEVRALAGPADAKPRRLVLKADRPQRLEFDTDWDEVGNVHVELEVRAEPSGTSGAQRLTLRGTLVLPGGRKVQASRQSVVDQHGTVLFELFRQQDRPFTLAIEATVSETWEVVSTPSVGARVRFDVEVFRISGPVRVSLERNMLNTFEDQSVRYEFQLGTEVEDEALTLNLTPVRLVDDLVEIRVIIAGRLPDGDDVAVIARDETLLANRGSANAVRAVAGDPPVGYEFVVTPRF